MKKKQRSPDKPQASPNPRPKRRNKKQREPMAKLKKKESPLGTPIQTPIQTPERLTVGNSFAALQNESEGEEGRSVDTITADDPQVEIESEQSDKEEQTELEASESPSGQNTSSTPDDVKQRPTSTGPIAQILPTDEE
jgi:hypothetical protein